MLSYELFYKSVEFQFFIILDMNGFHGLSGQHYLNCFDW